VLKDPIKRKNYDRTFDNFSYRKEEHLTPYQILQQIKNLKTKTGKLDPHRMDLDRLEFEITELLSERNLETLSKTSDKEITRQFIAELLETAKPLTPQQLKPITQHMLSWADDETREKIRMFLQSHRLNNNWNKYKLVFAIAGGIILCIFIYFLSR